MKIVILTSRYPYPLEKGDKLRIYHHIRLLAEDNEILLVSLTDEPVEESAVAHLNEMGVAVKIFHLSMFKRVMGVIRAFFSRLPFQVGIFFSYYIKRKIQEIILEFNPDVVYCQLLRMAPYANGLKYKLVIDYMDAFAYGMQRRADIVSFPLSVIYKIESIRMRKYEAKMFELFDAHIIISEQDKDRLKFTGAKDFHVLPNGVDTSFFNAKHNVTKKAYDIGMIGNLGYLPNVEAALFIIRKICPEIQPLNVLICGARPDDKLLKQKNKDINILGWVEDIREAYSSIGIFVAPIFSGTGQQNKILESMAMGVPAITTPEVNNAISAIEGRDILLASDKAEFVEKIELLSSNNELYQEIKNNALTFVRKNFSWEEKVEQLMNIFKS